MEISSKSEHLSHHRNQTLTTGRNYTQTHFLHTTAMIVIKKKKLNCLFLLLFFPVCAPPTEPENGGYRCHPSPCRLTQKTVIEYFCDEGYALKGDYKFLTCQNGEWDGPMQISCRLTQGPSPPFFRCTLSLFAVKQTWMSSCRTCTSRVSEPRTHVPSLCLSPCVPQTKSRPLRWAYRLCLLWCPQRVLCSSSCF